MGQTPECYDVDQNVYSIDFSISKEGYGFEYSTTYSDVGFLSNLLEDISKGIDSSIDKLQSWWEDPLGIEARKSQGRGGYGYGDINFTGIGLYGIFGGTFSFQLDPEGYAYVCLGPAVGTKGASLSATMSHYDPSHGSIVGLQVNAGVSGQLAYSFETESFFGELGGAYGWGFSVIGAYCFGPFGPFDKGHK